LTIRLVSDTIECLNESLSRIFPPFHPHDFEIRYTDSDGDRITVATTADLVEALSLPPPLLLTITPRRRDQGTVQEPPTPAGQLSDDIWNKLLSYEQIARACPVLVDLVVPDDQKRNLLASLQDQTKWSHYRSEFSKIGARRLIVRGIIERFIQDFVRDPGLRTAFLETINAILSNDNDIQAREGVSFQLNILSHTTSAPSLDGLISDATQGSATRPIDMIQRVHDEQVIRLLRCPHCRTVGPCRAITGARGLENWWHCKACLREFQPHSYADIGRRMHTVIEAELDCPKCYRRTVCYSLTGLDAMYDLWRCGDPQCGRVFQAHDPPSPSDIDGKLQTHDAIHHEERLDRNLNPLQRVFKATYKGHTVACKHLALIPDTSLTDAVTIFDSRINEYRRWSTIEHPHIVKLEAYYASTALIFFVMELLDCTLTKILSMSERQVPKRLGLPWNDDSKIQAARQIVNGVIYLHRQKAQCHSDIKPDNILVQVTTSTFKLGDLGDSRGTHGYQAPEIRNNTMNASLPGDIWALGITLFQLLFHERQTPIISATMPPVLPSLLPFQVLNSCVDPSPASRPAAEEVVHWLNALTNEQLRNFSSFEHLPYQRPT
jgi:hypothetical protein